MTILILVAVTIFVLALVHLKKKEKMDDTKIDPIPTKVEKVVEPKKVVKKVVKVEEGTDSKKETPKKKYYYNSKKKK
jgi:hypothetical protein